MTKLDAVMTEAMVSEQKLVTSANDRLTLDRLPSLAVGYYLNYWKTHMGWDDEMLSDVEEEIYVRDARFASGAAIVQVDFSGYAGETSMAFVFDAQGKLLHLFNYGETGHLLWFYMCVWWTTPLSTRRISFSVLESPARPDLAWILRCRWS